VAGATFCGAACDALLNFSSPTSKRSIVNHTRTSTYVQRIITTVTMPAKRIPASRNQPKGFFSATYDTLTDPENASIVRSVVIFGVREP
jgi:hypothetical protein